MTTYILGSIGGIALLLIIYYIGHRRAAKRPIEPDAQAATPDAQPSPEPTSEDEAKRAYRLGNQYFFGKEVERDYVKAAKYFQQAADQGHTIAHYNIGACYSTGQGVEKDHDKAAEHFRKAARNRKARALRDSAVNHGKAKGAKDAEQLVPRQ